MSGRLLLAIALFLVPVPASAQIVGQWHTNFGQGISEYSILLDREGKNYLTISDGSNGYGEEVSVFLSINGEGARPGSEIKFTIDGVELYFFADEGGSISTACRVCANAFDTLWGLIRRGDSLLLEFDGKAKRFPLRGSARALPKEPPPADFYR